MRRIRGTRVPRRDRAVATGRARGIVLRKPGLREPGKGA